MLCRSVIEKGYRNVLEAIEGAEMAEIRIEETEMSVDETAKVFASHPNLIATCRPVNLNDSDRKTLLETAIKSGAKWVDLEIESDAEFTSSLAAIAKAHDCKVIISYHNYDKTPSAKELDNILEESVVKQADLIKLACQVNDMKDNARLMCLYAQKHPVLVLGMGELGMITRIAALKMGAPFTFVRGNSLNATAPGQLDENQINSILKHL